MVAAAAPQRQDAGVFFGLDIGGTLSKLVFLQPREQPVWCDGRLTNAITSSTTFGDTGVRDSALSFESEALGGTVHFIMFSTDHIDGAVQFVKSRGLHQKIRKLCTAGGGAHKYAALFRENLKIELVPTDELHVVVRGISWAAQHLPREVYWIEEHMDTRHFLEAPTLFPFLLVNIGSGVSIVRVDSPSSFKRVSGTALGGGTFWGLCQLLTGCHSFSDAMDLAAEGDCSSVNLSVEDIYGGDYSLPSGQRLPGKLTASFFGKAGRTKDAPEKSATLQALAAMIAQNTCQIAYLNAQLQGISRVVFTGNFLRGNRVAERTISANMLKMSAAQVNGTEMRALFLAHEGYFGAMGSLLRAGCSEDPVPQSVRVLSAAPAAAAAGDAALKRAASREGFDSAPSASCAAALASDSDNSTADRDAGCSPEKRRRFDA